MLVYVQITAHSNGTVLVKVPYLSINQNWTVDAGETVIPISNTLTLPGTFQGGRGIYLYSDVNISVFVTNSRAGQRTAETFFALPVASLGRHYIVAAYSSHRNLYSALMVIGVMNGTHIKIVKPGSRGVLSITLNQLEVYQLVDYHDLTTSNVLADSPVAVVSGTACISSSAVSYPNVHIMMEQLVPVTKWAHSYIIPPLSQIQKFTVRVLTANYIATISISNPQLTYLISNVHDFVFSNYSDSVVITSDLPVSVMQYAFAEPSGLDIRLPFMLVVPGVNQYLNDYNIVIPELEGSLASYYLAIIVPSRHSHGVLLNGNAVSLTSSIQVSHPFDAYVIKRVDTRFGYNKVSHQNKTVMFGLVVYAVSVNEGIGFPAGIKLSKYFYSFYY